MLCRKPISLHPNADGYFASKDPANWIKGVAVPCGQCLQCRIQKRRQWTTRLYLEAQCHADMSFWTLTYSDENLTYAQSLPTLVYRDVQLFLKRLRKALPFPFRFYCGCEYGTQSFRPHYHIILFGVPSSMYEVVSRCWSSKASHTVGHCWLCVSKKHADPISQVPSALGNVYLGYDCSLQALQYVAGYITKKISSSRLPKNDKKYRNLYSDGRERERGIMSRNPGIGIPALLSISRQLKDVAFKSGSFPKQLSICGKSMPFDRTLLGYLSYLFPEFFNPMESSYCAKAEFDFLCAHPDMLHSVDSDLIDRIGKLSAFRFSRDTQKALNIEAKLRVKGVFDREA